MNERARVSIDAIRSKIPAHKDTEWVMVFGSQARGDQRPDSDLDILHIVSRWCSKYSDVHYRAIKDIIRGAPDGVQDVTILVETPLTIQKYGNLYGTTEYNALREGVVVYESKGAQRLHTYEMSDAESARRWLSLAYMQVLYGRQMRREEDRREMWQKSVTCSIKSLLRARGVRFSFVRDDPRALLALLPGGDAPGIGLGELEKPGEDDAMRAYDAVRKTSNIPETFATDDGPWAASDIPTCIADLESLRDTRTDQIRDVLDERIGILRRRHELLAGIADGVVVEPARQKGAAD